MVAVAFPPHSSRSCSLSLLHHSCCSRQRQVRNSCHCLASEDSLLFVSLVNVVAVAIRHPQWCSGGVDLSLTTHTFRYIPAILPENFSHCYLPLNLSEDTRTRIYHNLKPTSALYLTGKATLSYRGNRNHRDHCTRPSCLSR